jgi:PAS domain S-box-containing protein
MERFAELARTPGILDTQGILGFVLDVTNTGIWTWDVASDRVRWSREAYRIHGIEPGRFEGTGAAFFDLVHPEDRNRVRDAVSSALREGCPYSAAFRIVRPDGSIRRVTNRGRAIYPEGDTIVVGTITDVTELEQEMQRLYDQAAEEKNRLSMVLNNISEEVWFHDAAGRVILANPAAERGFGDVVGREIHAHADSLQVFRPDGTPRRPEENPVMRALAGEEIRDLEEIVKLPQSGDLRNRSVTSVPARSPEGSVLGVVSVVRDITERSAADRVLALNRSRLEYATRLSGIGFWYCDLPFDVLEWDERVKEHFYFEPTARITIDDFYARIHPEDRGQTRAAIEASIRDRAPYDIIYRTVHPVRGEIKWIRALGGTDYASDGTPTHFDGVTVDVSAQKLDQQRLASLNLQLREHDRRKDEFIATLSHELRNPLAPIRAAAKVIASPQVAPSQLQRAQAIIERQVSHIGALLDDLLDIARVTQGKLQLKKARVAIADVIDAAVEAVRPTLSSKHQQLSINMPAEPLVLDADFVRLSQILSNLLLNAAKYSDPRSRIEIAAAVEGETVKIAVKDDGIGIAAESIAGIFDMFSQIEGGTERSDGGLGIGLALVKGLTELHGGNVVARSGGLGLGSEFIVSLPLAPQNSAALPGAPGETPAKPHRQRILIADDNEDAAESLAMLLQLEGHEVRVAHSGRDALSLAEAFHPELALLDIGLPDLSGHQVAQTLRGERWAAPLRLIAVTGWGSDEDRQRALEAGFDHHLTKPIDSNELNLLIGRRDPQSRESK